MMAASMDGAGAHTRLGGYHMLASLHSDMICFISDYEVIEMLDLDNARYSLAVSSKIWGVTTPTGRLYLNEYLSLSAFDRRASGQGGIALLTARRVLQGAIGAELAPLFRTAALACAAAKEFTDVASSDEAPGYEREPGRLYGGRAKTALIAYPSGRGVVVRVDAKTPLRQIFHPIGGAGLELGGRQERGSFLLLDPVVDRVEQMIHVYNSGGVI